jgi:hypothetical protein
MIPSAVLRDTLSIEPYLGEGASGPSYGAAVSVPAKITAKKSSVTLPDGRKGKCALQALIRPGTEYPILSRVTAGGRVFIVLESEEITELTRSYCWRLSLGWGAA